jgi:hypothetical protein
MSPARHMTPAELAAWHELARAAKKLRQAQTEASRLRRRKRLKVLRLPPRRDEGAEKGGPPSAD